MNHHKTYIWIMLGFLSQALSGLFLNVIFLKSDPAALGIFNELYAYFIVTSLLGSFSIHESCLVKITLAQEENEKLKILSTGVKSVLLTSTICAFILFFVFKFFSFTKLTPQLQSGLTLMSFSIILISLNRVFSSYFLSLHQSKLYSFTLCLRSTLLVGLIVTWEIVIRGDRSYFGIMFSITEILVLVYNLMNIPLSKFVSIFRTSNKLVSHFKFGKNAIINSLFSDTFFRVDILVLSFFVLETHIGIYSFVAFFIEGIMQISVLLRQNFNALITQHHLDQDLVTLKKHAQKICLTSGTITTLSCVTAYFTIPFVSHFIRPENSETISQLLLILLPGFCLYSFLIPIEQTNLMLHKPINQSIYMLFITFSNLILNLILVPVHGIFGAAIATSVAFVVATLAISVMYRKIYMSF